jgi:hypothetical protein
MFNLALALPLLTGKPSLKGLCQTVVWLLSQPWIRAASNLILISIFGLTLLAVVYWQYRTSRNQLRLDIFDRRLPVFEAAMKLAGTIASKGDISREEVQEFAIASRSVRFLFNQKLQDYCDELHEAALLVWAGRQKSQETPLTDEEATRSETITERVLWFNEQLSNGIPKRFTPFLRILG